MNAIEQEELAAAVEVVCKFCNAKGHTEQQCRKKKNKDKKCTYCGKQYHDESQCHKKRRDERKVPASGDPPPAILTSGAAPTAINNTQESDSSRVSISRAGLLSLLQQLDGGQQYNHIQDLRRCQEALGIEPVVPDPPAFSSNPLSLDTQDKEVLRALSKSQLSVMQSRSMTQANNANSGSFYCCPHNDVLSSVEATTSPTDLGIALSLCDGIGCFTMVLQRIGAKLSRFIAVELEEDARIICQNANPATAEFPGVDHS